MLFIGSSDGLVRVFSQDEVERAVLGDKSKDLQLNAVTFMDVSRDERFLVTGHKAGHVALWDIVEMKSVKIMGEAHRSQILCVKFFGDTSNVLSADFEGNVCTIEFSKGMFAYKATKRQLLRAVTTPCGIAPLPL